MAPPIVSTPLWIDASLTIAGSVLMLLQLLRLWSHYFPNRKLEKLFSVLASFYIVNRYGIFAVMTTTRFEIVIEGSEDEQEWKEYLFRYKPSEITRRPRRISPFQPRLDWQVWFLPFTSFHSERWFQHFIYHLLKGTPDVLILLRSNPFPKKPPKYIRVLMYIYEFSSRDEKKSNGWWWRRIYVEQYSPTLTLKDK